MTHSQNAPIAISPLQLSVRCFAERSGNQWQAFSVEFGLAAQDDTLEGVKSKLDDMIADYLDDILTVDRDHAWSLLSRRAPLSVRLRYFVYSSLRRFFHGAKERGGFAFREILPITFQACPA